LRRLKLVDLAGKNAAIAAFGNDGQISLTQLFAEIESAACEHNAGCIILDAVADFFGGNENERREVRAFVSALRGLAMRLKAAVVFLAHPSVDGIKTGRGYSGSTHWNNAVRSRLYFTDAPAEEGGPPNPDLRVIELAKSNRARRGEKVHLMWNEGRFITVTPGAVENLTNEAEAQRLFLELLSKVNKQGMNVSPNRSNNYAPVVLAKMFAARQPSPPIGPPTCWPNMTSTPMISELSLAISMPHFTASNSLPGRACALRTNITDIAPSHWLKGTPTTACPKWPGSRFPALGSATGLLLLDALRLDDAEVGDVLVLFDPRAKATFPGLIQSSLVRINLDDVTIGD
jgi:hypothetical protein